MFSASMLSTFTKCKKMFSEIYIKGNRFPSSEAQEFGKLVHSTIPLLTDFNAELFDPNVVKMIRALQQDELYKSIKISEYEKKVNAEIGGKKFLGFIDALGEYNGNPCIIEYKTSKANFKSEDFEDTKIQTGLYSLMLGIEQVMVVVLTKHVKPRIQIELSPPKATQQEIISICSAIESEFSFSPIPSEKCWFCNLRETNCEAHF